jgi:putative ABC transport system ATP-binding protein
MQAPPEQEQALINQDPNNVFLQLRNLTRIYQEGDVARAVLSAVNGEILRGEVVALLGRSGSGKSTLLNLIAGIDAPTQGEVVIDGRAISQLDERARTLFRRRHIGFIYQFFNLVPTLTVEENLLLPLELNGWDPEAGRNRARRLLEAVGLSDRGSSFPDCLSGGEQQRVAVARALVHEPALVLADEPTGNLDAENGLQILELLHNLVHNQGCTLILVTHSKAVAARADRVLCLQRGQLLEQDAEVLW